MCGDRYLRSCDGSTRLNPNLLFLAGPQNFGEITVQRINVVDADGTLRMVLSSKDRMHPGVLEVAAIGAHDEKSGEAVKIVVVRKDPALTRQQLLAHCAQHLTGYKVPKIVEFRTEVLPKTNIGKILRRQLREPTSI